MYFLRYIVCLLLTFTLGVGSAFGWTLHLKTLHVSPPPEGHKQFCSDFPSHCKKSGGLPYTPWSPRLEKLLGLVNREVNDGIEHVSDLDKHGYPEVWELNPHTGDCEEYTIRKRAWLINENISPNALRLTWVKTERNEDHLVLMVITDRDDFVLDNRFKQVKKIADLIGYDFIKQTSGWDPTIWVKLEDTRIDLRKETLAEIQKK